MLLVLAQAPFDYGPLALVALVPWLVAIDSRASALGSAALSFAVGTLYAAGEAPWIWQALRGLGASPTSSMVGLLVTAAWTKGVPYLAIGWILHALGRQSAGARVLAVSALFFAVESLQSRFALGLPLGLLGHTQGVVPGLAQLAVVGGVPLVSALVAALNQSIACALARPRAASVPLRLVSTLGVAWLSLAVLGVPVARALREESGSAGEALQFLLVQPNIPRGHRWAPDLQRHHFERVAAYTEEALRRSRDRGIRPDAVLWPENLITLPLDEETGGWLRAATTRLDVPVITGLVRAPASGDPQHYRSSVVWLAPGGGIVDALDKEIAIPLLESSRRGWGTAWLAAAFGSASDGPRVEEARDSRPLRGPFSATPVLCFEALFPALTASRRDAATRVILNLADDGWVPGDSATRQLTAAVRFRAIEQRLPLVRVAHGGLSAAFDPLGRSIVELPRRAYAHATVEIRPAAPPTIVERGMILALPLTASGVVWCACEAWVQRRRARASGGTS